MFKPLRDKILELAITGKLVPQMDSEPAVEQIGPAPAKEEEPFALPEKWKWVQLEQVAQYRPSVKAEDELEVSFAPLEKLSDGYNNFFCFDMIERWGEVKKGFSRFCDGDVIFAKIHPSFQNRKSAVVTRAHNGIGCGSTEYCVFRCKEPLFNQYLLWFFKSEYFISFGKNTFKGTVGQQRVNLDVITTMYFPLPPLEEQRRIVAKLDDIMGNLERMDQAYTDLSGPMLKHFKNLVLQQAISGQLVPQLDSEPSVEQIGPAPAKEDEPFALPKKWKWVRLKSLADHIQYGYTASASDSGEVKLLRITDLHEGKVNWDSVPFCSISSADIAKFKLLPNDIVIARSGATVGKSFKVGQIEHEAVFASYLIRIGLNDKLPVSASYIKTYLDSPTYWYSIFQSARGTAMKNVNAQQLGALLIPLPPLEEQRRIVARIEELFGDVDKLLEWQQFA